MLLFFLRFDGDLFLFEDTFEKISVNLPKFYRASGFGFLSAYEG